jgi:hypothetical protein
VAFKGSQSTRALIGGLHLSGYLKSINMPRPVMNFDTTTLLDAAKTFAPGQDAQASFNLAMLLDTDATTGGQWSTITGWKGAAASPLTLAPGGLTTGSEAWLVNALNSGISPASPINGVSTFTASGVVTGAVDYGTIVEDLTAITIDGNGTARDGGAASSNGGVAHIHSTAFSGLTNNIVTIEHSVDGSTSWATLVTFATITGLTGERVEVAPATTVRRYLRVVDNVTGTGSNTRSVAFARR